MMGVEKEDWSELIRLLKETDASITALNGENFDSEIVRSRQSLKSFHTTAAMLGLGDLEKAGIELEKYLTTQIESPDNVDVVSSFGFAVNTLIDQMHGAENGDGSGRLDIGEVLEILGAPEEEESAAAPAKVEAPPEPVKAEAPPAPAKEEVQPEPAQAGGDASLVPVADAVQKFSDFIAVSRLEGLVKSLGGELVVDQNGGSSGKFSLTFSGSMESLKKFEDLLSSEVSARGAMPNPWDDKLDKIMAKGQEFMDALSGGNVIRAQEILASLADQQQAQPGLYKEIGGLARSLHESIRGFINTMDPSLKEIVEDQIPDSGCRLEHMLKMTEKAANTTLDHVDSMNERLNVEKNDIARLRELLANLKAFGDKAQSKLDESGEILKKLDESNRAHSDDLGGILTAQDYQDLSGQIIQKITKLLKELELKLVNVIRTFGAKVETSKKKSEEEELLYGPAHDDRENSLHSQDDVDSLLAEFGF